MVFAKAMEKEVTTDVPPPLAPNGFDVAALAEF